MPPVEKGRELWFLGLFPGQSHHRRHSCESRNPGREIVNQSPNWPTIRFLDSGFRRSDGCVVYGAIALGLFLSTTWAGWG